MIRKINSCLSLATAALFLFHASLMCLLLSGTIPYRPWYHAVGGFLLILLMGHAILSMFIFFMNMEERKTVRTYWKSNRATAAQRSLAIMMLFMAFVHLQTGTGMWGFQVVYIAVASGHTALSFPRAMLSMGAVGSESAYKRLRLVSVAFGFVLPAWAAVSYGIFALSRS